MLMNAFPHYKALPFDLLAGLDHLAGVLLAGIFVKPLSLPKTCNSNPINYFHLSTKLQ